MAKKSRRDFRNIVADHLPPRLRQCNEDGDDSAYCIIEGETYQLPGSYDSSESIQSYLLLCKLIESQDITIGRLENERLARERFHVNEILRREEVRFEHGGLIFTNTLVVESLRRRDSVQVRREKAAAERERQKEKERTQTNMWHLIYACKYYAPARLLARRHDEYDFSLPSSGENELPELWFERLLESLARLVYPNYETSDESLARRAKRRVLRLLVEILAKDFKGVSSSKSVFTEAIDFLIEQDSEAYRVLRLVQPRIANQG